MKQKRIIGLSLAGCLAVVLVVGLVWKLGAQTPLSAQTFAITDTSCNLEEGSGMQMGAQFQERDDDGFPAMEVTLTNNSGKTFDVAVESVEYKDGDSWRKCTRSMMDPLAQWQVLSEADARKLESNMDGAELSNTLKITQNPWGEYMNLTDPGSYRMNLQFLDEDSNPAGQAYVEWRQSVTSQAAGKADTE